NLALFFADGQVAQVFVELRVALEEHAAQLRMRVDDLADARDVVYGRLSNHPGAIIAHQIRRGGETTTTSGSPATLSRVRRIRDIGPGCHADRTRRSDKACFSTCGGDERQSRRDGRSARQP